MYWVEFEKDVQGGNKTRDDIVINTDGEGIVRVRLVRDFNSVTIFIIPLNRQK